MKNEGEELSTDDILSSIRTAVLDTKAPSADFANLRESIEEVFELTADMELKNYPSDTISEKDFDVVSMQILRKFARAFATGNLIRQNQNRVMAKEDPKSL